MNSVNSLLADANTTCWSHRRSSTRLLYEAMLKDRNLDTWAHLPFFFEVARGNVLEIGVHCGISTTAFLAGLEEHGGRLYSVDVHPSCRYVHYGHPQWVFYCPWAGDVPTPDLPLDVLYIDGDHSYAAVLNDLNTWGPHAKLILCHDATWPDVRKAIDEFCSSRKCLHYMRPDSSGLEVIHLQ